MKSYVEFIKESESHYSDDIESLMKKDGWKSSGKSLLKTFKGLSIGGKTNPNGDIKLEAQWDTRRRYLSIYAGFDIIVDFDARGVNPATFVKGLDKAIKTAYKKKR